MLVKHKINDNKEIIIRFLLLKFSKRFFK